MLNYSDKQKELTLRSILLGIILSIILSAANTYLGLFAGMTVSASIPAAIVSMTILRFFKNSTIHENNLVQTSASAGESLAAGVIFTFPALVLIGYWTNFNYYEVTKIALVGGILGALFTIPLRKTLIVNQKLKFPEGVATSKILKSSNDINLSKIILQSSCIGAITKFSQSAINLWNSSLNYFFQIKNSIFGFSIDLSPALIGVGYIIGLNISILVFTGGIISWLIAIPIYSAFNPSNGDITNYAWMIWDSKIRFLGVGAMLTGGFWSIIKIIKPIINGISNSIYNKDSQSKDIPLKYILLLFSIIIIPIYSVYNQILTNIPISIIITILIIVIAFTFSSIAGYMSGIVGSSKNPVSGLTNATILLSALFIKYLGFLSYTGMVSSVLFGSIICCSAAIAGDNMQDLKTGHIINSTPWMQQTMQIIGTVSSALVITLILNILHSAYGIGSESLPAPQANLMKVVVEGVFNENLPWLWIYAGMFIGIIVICLDLIQEQKKSSFRLPVLALAVGIYLPIGLSSAIFIGGLISSYTNKNKENGILFSSGLITGEAIMGILIAIPIFITSNLNRWKINFITPVNILGFIAFTFIIYSLYKSTKKK